MSANLQNKDSYQNVERRIYQEYLDEIVPLIAAIEVYDNEFPAEILNEVRSIFTHFARSSMASSEDEKRDNFDKAERHLKRMKFDCHKYVSSMHSMRVGELLDAFSPKVLAGVNDGAFLVEVNRMLRVADNKIIDAKKHEAAGDESKALDSYAAATELYADLVEYIEGSKESLAHSQALYGSFEEDVQKSGRIGLAVGAVGAVIGVVGVVISILT